MSHLAEAETPACQERRLNQLCGSSIVHVYPCAALALSSSISASFLAAMWGFILSLFKLPIHSKGVCVQFLYLPIVGVGVILMV